MDGWMDARVGEGGRVGEWRAFGGGGDVSTAQRARGPAEEAGLIAGRVAATSEQAASEPAREDGGEAGFRKGVS